jgi:hypothetical protein
LAKAKAVARSAGKLITLAPFREVAAVGPASKCIGSMPIRSASRGLGGGYKFDFDAVPSFDARRPRHRRCRHRLRAHRARPRPRRLRIWMDSARICRSAASPRSPMSWAMMASTRTDAPRLRTGARVIDDNGKKGDANNRVIEALAERRQAHRARPAEAPVPAFLALQEAGDLPQHAAMVRLYGQGHRSLLRPCDGRCRRSRRRHAPQGVRGAQPPAIDARVRGDKILPELAGQNRLPAAMIADPPRLGAVAPARLGRADHRLRQGTRQRRR